MAKKVKVSAEATIYEKATQLIELRKQITMMENQEKFIVADLRAHVRDTGEKTINGLLAYERTGVAKFEGLENKALDVAKEQLVNELDPTYVKKGLDTSKMFAALQTDKALYGHLAQKGLTLVQPVELYFKVAK
jgi:hypothetical protein